MILATCVAVKAGRHAAIAVRQDQAMTQERSIHNPVTGETWIARVRGRDTGGAAVEGRGLLPPGTRPPGVHRHPHQEERITVVSGRICVRLGDEEREYGPGESAVLPAGVWHDFWVVGDETADTIGRAEPALGLEMILGTLAGLAKEGKTDRRGRPRPLQGAVIGQFYDEVAQFKVPPPAVMRLLLPPLAALGRKRGYRPYYERHFEPGEIDEILDHWGAHRPWAANRRPEA
jgi:quercetin dioxygenase-like cupin family protein